MLDAVAAGSASVRAAALHPVVVRRGLVVVCKQSLRETSLAFVVVRLCVEGTACVLTRLHQLDHHIACVRGRDQGAVRGGLAVVQLRGPASTAG